MEHIVAPIVRNDRGAAMHNLHDALVLLLTRKDTGASGIDVSALTDKLGAERRGGFHKAGLGQTAADGTKIITRCFCVRANGMSPDPGASTKPTTKPTRSTP
jgi:hypothetical protein